MAKPPPDDSCRQQVASPSQLIKSGVEPQIAHITAAIINIRPLPWSHDELSIIRTAWNQYKLSQRIAS